MSGSPTRMPLESQSLSTSWVARPGLDSISKESLDRPMPLITADQVTYFPPIFEPEYESGSHGEINPLTGAVYGAYGLTIIDYEKRSAALIRLSDRTHPKGSAYGNKQKFVPVPAPDFVEDFPPE